MILDKTFFTRNRQALYETLPDGALLALFSGELSHRSADEEYRFCANRNFIYMTGVPEPDNILLARRVRGEIVETLYIRDPDPEVEKWTGRRITVAEAAETSGVSDVAMRSAFDAVFNKLANDTYYTEIHLCLESNPNQDRTDRNRDFQRTVAQKYPGLTVRNAFPQIAALRMIKSPEEISSFEEATAVTCEGIERMMAAGKYAKTEMDLFAEFMYVINKHGSVEPAFKPIISCGANNFFLHYDTPTGKLTEGELCLVDVGACKNFCNVDISRVFPCRTVFSERQKLIYEIALEINDIVTAAIKPGMFFSDINQMNRELTLPRLKSAGLLSDPADLSKYVWHRCSHHIGFDVHDVGSYELPLCEAMFFSMDMGIYVREWGIGLRIEDDVLMTEGGLRRLSGDIPRTIADIEEAIAR